MKNWITIVALFLFARCFSQDAYLAHLPIMGNVKQIGVSPSEKLFIVSQDGGTFQTSEIGSLWQFGPFGSYSDFYIDSQGSFGDVTYFSEDIIMISGYIQSDNSDEDFVYRTTDGGKNWEKIKFGTSSWIHSVYATNDGKAWMGGSSGFIYYTEDSGKSWKQFGKTGKGKENRITSIFFKEGKTGWIGTDDGRIKMTVDNCKNWTELPTPISQHKYRNGGTGFSDEIDKVRQFSDFYFVRQAGRVFYTKKDQIDWIAQPNITDFEVTEDNKLYVVNKDLTVELLDSVLSSKYKSTEKIDAIAEAIAVKNNALFAFTGSKIYKIDLKEFIASELLTDKIAIEAPYDTLVFKKELYGLQYKTILKFDAKRELWFRLMELPFRSSNSLVYDDKLLVSNGFKGQYYSVNTSDKTLDKYEVPKRFFDLEANEIVAFSVLTESVGCFHSSIAERKYVRKGNEFVNEDSSNPFLKKMPNKINASLLNEILEEFDGNRFAEPKTKDLEIGEEDLMRFKKFIESEKKSNKDRNLHDFDDPYLFPAKTVDYDFYINVANNFKTLPDDLLAKVLNEQESIHSTSRMSRILKMELKNGDNVIFRNDDFMPKYLFAPWSVEINGFLFTTNSLKIANKINELTSEELINKELQDKKQAIFLVANYLYKQLLRE